ncbi:MAG: Trk system potassium transport protein TrkA [Treponema sp.]|jgi:trk system potassium uptake protein TrkA|nr:Trk system potassium transport protein TrkA [Treponema sp.]
MRVVIVGAGTVGTQLARHLIQEKHDVSLIEANPERARHASNHMDCLVLEDKGNSIYALEEAGIARADALVCVTESDELNMIICGLAESRYPGLIKIARVRNDDYVRLNRPEGDSSPEPRILGINYFIHPDVEASRKVLSAVEHGVLGDIISFAGTSYELGAVDIAGSSPLDGLVLTKYRAAVPGESLVTLVERGRGSGAEVILPAGSTVLEKGDRVFILAREGELDHIFRLAGHAEKPLRKIGIVGGGRLGCLIAEGLLEKTDPSESRGMAPKRRGFLSLFRGLIAKRNYRVVIIEQDYSLCKELAARFPEALVLNEDLSDENFISEERIDDLDLIITATGQQEFNIINAVYLKSRGVGRTIAMVSSPGYAAVARKLGVDVVIPMKMVVVDSILSHLMGNSITAVHRLGDGSIDILELDTGEDAPVAGKALKECRLPADSLVMLVNREGSAFIPKGDDVIQSGDHTVLITKKGNEAEISRLFDAAP